MSIQKQSKTLNTNCFPRCSSFCLFILIMTLFKFLLFHSGGLNWSHRRACFYPLYVLSLSRPSFFHILTTYEREEILILILSDQFSVKADYGF